MTRWGTYVGQRLDEIGRGEGREHWEGKWPSPGTVDGARYVAGRAFPDGAPTPSVVPTEDGEVAFIWRKAGWDIEVTCLEGCYSTVSAHFRAGGRDGIEGNLSDLLPRFRELMTELGARP